MSGNDDKPKVRYSDSPYAPDWARDPVKKHERQVTSFGKPLPETPFPFDERQPGQTKPQAKDPPESSLMPGEETSLSSVAMFRPTVEALEGELWADVSVDLQVYALLDGEHCHGLYGRLLNSDLSWCHLYQGESAVLNVQGGPFLVALRRGHDLTRWLVEEGWGQGWGIYCVASTQVARALYRPDGGHAPVGSTGRDTFVKLRALSAEDDDPLLLLRRHFRRFTHVEFEDDGRIVQFRFYDPMVLRTYLPTCNPDEIAGFFGPVDRFYCEGFNEVSSLNRPQDIYRFSAPVNATSGKRKFSGQCQSMEADRTVSLPQFEASEGRLERQPGPYVTIRSAQRQVFQRVQALQFQERVACVLERLALRIGKRPNRSGVRSFAARHIEAGRGYGLDSERVLAAFASCAFACGAGFEKESEPVRVLLNSLDTVPPGEQAEFFENLAEMHLMNKEATP